MVLRLPAEAQQALSSSRKVWQTHFRTFVPLSLALPTPAALTSDCRVSSEQDQPCVRSRPLSSGGNLVLRAVGPPQVPVVLIHGPPWVPPPACGTLRVCRGAFPERSMRRRLRRSAGYLGTVGVVAGEAPAGRGWGPRRLGSPLLEANPLGPWSSQLPSTFKDDSCNLPGIVFLVPR
ncbi:unnamed protein product [Rangifer tarandus platyrhynchus]|uniref:Uncharacterized protein n=1 Tax=Rangifer tarandus platyrhynchus TaxID=3082113 RepID=A0AC59YBK1_RANTA